MNKNKWAVFFSWFCCVYLIRTHQERMAKSLFVTCARGLEPILANELASLGYKKRTQEFRGNLLYFSNTEETLNAVYRLNYLSRVAMRVLYPLKKFRVSNKDDLYHQVKKINWSDYLRVDQTFAIQSNISDNRAFDNSLYVTQLTKDAIADHFYRLHKKRPSVDKENPDVQLNLYLHREDAVLSLDTSGLPLYKRGYKESNTEASLAENLAAALLQLAGWTNEKFSAENTVFCDPLVGSGTLLTEAMMIASNMPAGFKREKFGFFSMPNFNEQAWLEMKRKEDDKIINISPVHKKCKFMAADIDQEAIKMTRKNLEALEFENSVKLTCASITDYDPPVPPNFVVTDPPYGIRLNSTEDEELKRMYKEIGDFLKKKTAKPAQGFILTTKELAKCIGLSTSAKHIVYNGGLETRLLAFDLYDGTRKFPPANKQQNETPQVEGP